MKTVKKQSIPFKIIIAVINVLCLLQAIGTTIMLILIPFMPPSFRFNFSVSTDGLYAETSSASFPFVIPEMVGIAFFEEEFPPNYMMNIYWFIISLITLYLLLEFKKFVDSVVEQKSFGYDNYKRFRHMGLAFLIALILDSIAFFVIDIPMAKLIQHDSIIINASYSFSKNFNWSLLLLGFTFIVLSEVFKEGFSLKQETDLTI